MICSECLNHFKMSKDLGLDCPRCGHEPSHEEAMAMFTQEREARKRKEAKKALVVQEER